MTSDLLIYNEPRFIATAEIINSVANDLSFVVEVGASDASFRNFVRSQSWMTVDKYGSPDIKVDLNSAELELPFPNNSVDVVICTEVLEHLTLGTPLVREMSRILKPTGYAIISVPNIVSLKSRIKVLIGMLPGMAASGDCGNDLGGTGILIDGHWVGAHVVDFNSARLYRYLSRSGLIVEKHWSIPTCIDKPIKLKIGKNFLPKSLLDFIIVTARTDKL